MTRFREDKYKYVSKINELTKIVVNMPVPQYTEIFSRVKFIFQQRRAHHLKSGRISKNFQYRIDFLNFKSSRAWNFKDMMSSGGWNFKELMSSF